jgi:hypothetical protein
MSDLPPDFAYGGISSGELGLSGSDRNLSGGRLFTCAYHPTL